MSYLCVWRCFPSGLECPGGRRSTWGVKTYYKVAIHVVAGVGHWKLVPWRKSRVQKLSLLWYIHLCHYIFGVTDWSGQTMEGFSYKRIRNAQQYKTRYILHPAQGPLSEAVCILFFVSFGYTFLLHHVTLFIGWSSVHLGISRPSHHGFGLLCSNMIGFVLTCPFRDSFSCDINCARPHLSIHCVFQALLSYWMECVLVEDEAVSFL